MPSARGNAELEKSRNRIKNIVFIIVIFLIKFYENNSEKNLDNINFFSS